MYRAREEAEEKKEAERKQAAAVAKAVFKAQLADQIAERKAVRDGKRVEVATEELALEQTHQVRAWPAAALLYYCQLTICPGSRHCCRKRAHQILLEVDIKHACPQYRCGGFVRWTLRLRLHMM